jgi:hypothetical protein
MKKVSKICAACIGLIGLFLSTAGLTACENAYGIPNGYYRTFNAQGEISTYDYYWYVKNNRAEYYASGSLAEKCTIIESDGKLYFDYAGGQHTEAHRYEVQYDETDKVLTVFSSSNETKYKLS